MSSMQVACLCVSAYPHTAILSVVVYPHVVKKLLDTQAPCGHENIMVTHPPNFILSLNSLLCSFPPSAVYQITHHNLYDGIWCQIISTIHKQLTERGKGERERSQVHDKSPLIQINMMQTTVL